MTSYMQFFDKVIRVIDDVIHAIFLIRLSG